MQLFSTFCYLLESEGVWVNLPVLSAIFWLDLTQGNLEEALPYLSIFSLEKETLPLHGVLFLQSPALRLCQVYQWFTPQINLITSTSEKIAYKANFSFLLLKTPHIPIVENLANAEETERRKNSLRILLSRDNRC